MSDISHILHLEYASRDLMSSRALLGLLEQCNCYSAIWRMFLIVFPNKRNTILDPQTWTSQLTSKREMMKQKFRNDQYRPAELATYKNISEIKTFMNERYRNFTGKEAFSKIDILLKILSFSHPNLGDSKTLDTKTKSIISIIVRLLIVFESEASSRYQGTFGILMNPDYFAHDICLCMESINLFLQPFDQNSNMKDTYQQICYMINHLDEEIKSGLHSEIFKQDTNDQSNSHSLPFAFQLRFLRNVSQTIPNSDKPIQLPTLNDMPEILNLFHNLFLDITRYNEINDVWSIIFSRFNDQSIFPTFYGYIYLFSRKAIPDSPMPMLAFGTDIGSEIRAITEKDEYRIASERVDELIHILQEDDSILNREIARYEIDMIIQVARGKAHVEDLLPIQAVMDVVKPSYSTPENPQ